MHNTQKSKGSNWWDVWNHLKHTYLWMSAHPLQPDTEFSEAVTAVSNGWQEAAGDLFGLSSFIPFPQGKPKLTIGLIKVLFCHCRLKRFHIRPNQHKVQDTAGQSSDNPTLSYSFPSPYLTLFCSLPFPLPRGHTCWHWVWHLAGVGPAPVLHIH